MIFQNLKKKGKKERHIQFLVEPMRSSLRRTQNHSAERRYTNERFCDQRPKSKPKELKKEKKMLQTRGQQLARAFLSCVNTKQKKGTPSGRNRQTTAGIITAG